MKAIIRPMFVSERNFVLAGWKRDLWEAKPPWGRSLRADEWWSLVNYVINNIVWPRCAVSMACHEDEPLVPMAWAAFNGDGCVHCKSVIKDAEISAYLQVLLKCSDQVEFNPFTEMKKCDLSKL